MKKTYYFEWCVIFIGINLLEARSDDPQTLAVVISNDFSKLEDFIQILEPPSTISGTSTPVVVEYRCSTDRLVGVEVVSDIDNVVVQKVFQKVWWCHKSADLSDRRLKKVKLKLPPEVAYNYNAFNKAIKFTSRSKLRAWILDPDWWASCKRNQNCFTRSFVKVAYDLDIAPPFSRPYFKPARQCTSWRWNVITMATSFKIPTCSYEEETVDVICYPVVLTGDHYGVIRQFKPYQNPELEHVRQSQISSPRFTVAFWLYILEYCPGVPRQGKLCSIMHRFTWDGDYRTMLLLLTPEGRLHVQTQDVKGQQTAGVTHFTVPRLQWIRLVLQFRVNNWKLFISYGENFNETLDTEYTHQGLPILYDDAKDLFAFGGSEFMPSYKGYIGQAIIYRNRIVQVDQVCIPSRYHPMFELKLTRREERCQSYIQWAQTREQHYKERYRIRTEKYKCKQPFQQLVENFVTDSSRRNLTSTCPTFSTLRGRARRAVSAVIKDLVWREESSTPGHVAERLYENISRKLDEGLENIPKIFPLLKLSACYGNLDAMYMVSVLLNNGIYMKSDEIQSQAYLMLGALENHRLSALALGHKHVNGIDGVSLDLEQSYRYFKFVADTTNADKELHKDTDVFTESIRLTDEVAIHEQTDEDGDIFHWLTHQAKQGVLSAQTRIGRALFWGQQGLKRNLEAAVEYFRMSADTGDPQSQYDYGIVLMRGQGTRKDMKAGLQHLQKAAEQKNPSAINAIGWHAMRFERDYVKAAEYFERAHRMGNSDATYNLGILHLHGRYPGRQKDADKALDYFRKAGVAGQLDAGVAIAYQTIKGTSSQPRDVVQAVEWARFIAEKNPAVGLLLRKAIQEYRKGKRDVSLFYYALVAGAGLEVGSFNYAWLCEENKNGITSFIEKECVWSQYNISTQRQPQFVDTYASLKMGDYFWYGCQGHKDVKRAARYYGDAAKKHDPQALFNLGFMIEEGATIPPSILDDVRVPKNFRKNNVTLLTYLYTRCRDSHRSEAFVPCSLALWRVQALNFWSQYHVLIKLTGFTGAAAMAAVSSYVILRTHLRSRPQIPDNI